MSNSLRQPRQMRPVDPPAPKKRVDSPEPGKVVSIVGLRISEPKRTLSQIYDRGLFRYTEGRFDEACLDFKQASQDPQHLISCILMASRCYQRSDKKGEAIALLKAAIWRKGCTEADAQLFRDELAPLLPVAAGTAVGVEPQPLLHEVPAAETAVRSEAPVETSPATSAPVDLYAAPTSKIITIPFGLFISAILLAGYFYRVEQFLTAESGLGYQLGIIGSLLMLVLMLYPLRKKTRFMRNWGPIPYWFRFHMLAGIIGPVLILFHANFQVGSLNSQVVLGSTLLVAGSGLFGRYLYTKIHFGLYGKRVSLEQLHEAISTNHNNLAAVFLYAPKIQERLLCFDEAVMRPTSGLLQSIGRVVSIDMRQRWTHLRIKLVLRRALRVATRRNNWSRHEMMQQYRAANRLISKHLTAVLKVAEFSFYERFFSLWHILHMPLFLLMAIALVLHVIAVHMY